MYRTAWDWVQSMQASSFETLPYVCAKLPMFSRLWGKLYYSSIIYIFIYIYVYNVCVCVCVCVCVLNIRLEVYRCFAK